MKNFSTTLSVIAVVIGAMFATVKAEVKIASVNMTDLNIMFYKRTEVEVSLRKQEAAIKEEISVREQKVKALVEQAQSIQKKSDPTLSEEAMKKLREQAASVQNELTAEGEELKTFIQRREIAFREIARRELKLLSDELHATVQAVAAAEKVDIVIDSSASIPRFGSAYSVFPYVKPSMDITEKVLKKLNAGAPADFDAKAELKRVRGEQESAPAGQQN